MEMSYFANSQEMGLAGNLLYPNDTISSQQFYYEYNTDYLYAPQFPGTITTECSNITNLAANHFDSVSCSQIGSYPLVSAENFQPNSIEVVPFESSIFLTPQTSTPSSAAQSPQVEVQPNDDIFDLPFDEIFNIDELLSDELLEVLNDVESGDFLKQLEVITADKDFDSGASFISSNSSATSTPKRKYSTDSSDCSLDSFESSSTISENNNKTKRARHSKTNPERASRKKDQNKKAASRYRNKKKNEMQSSEETLEQLESHRDNLSEQVKKLQTEFNVILPLAQAAFTFDPIRREHLNQLISRINTLL